MGHIGTTELLLILAVALLIFGPAKLPQLGKMAGKAVGSFRHYVDSAESWDLDEEDESASKTEKVQPAKAEEPAQAAAETAPQQEEQPVQAAAAETAR